MNKMKMSMQVRRILNLLAPLAAARGHPTDLLRNFKPASEFTDI
jgi:hypothetical protein